MLAPRILALALALGSGTGLKPPRIKVKLPTTSRRVATLEPPLPAVDNEPRVKLREASPLTVDAAWLTTTQQLDDTPATRQLDESNETPTHWRRAARVQRDLEDERVLGAQVEVDEEEQPGQANSSAGTPQHEVKFFNYDE